MKRSRQASSLCALISGKPSLVRDTLLAPLAMVDPIIVALPVSIIVTGVLTFVLKPDLSITHLEKCFSGINVKKSKIPDGATVRA
jgi:SSS family solute:Na+ symporter